VVSGPPWLRRRPHYHADLRSKDIKRDIIIGMIKYKIKEYDNRYDKKYVYRSKSRSRSAKKLG
jgi:hypothetical protein